LARARVAGAAAPAAGPGALLVPLVAAGALPPADVHAGLPRLLLLALALALCGLWSLPPLAAPSLAAGFLTHAPPPPPPPLLLLLLPCSTRCCTPCHARHVRAGNAAVAM
jgi:hypothetical protein